MRYTVNHIRKVTCILVTLMTLLGVILSACTEGTPTPTAEPLFTPTATALPPTAQPEAAIDLDGTTWYLLSYVDGQGSSTKVLPDSTIDITFAPGKVTGTAGCNRYFSDTHVEGNSIGLGMIGTTRMACGDTVDMQEVAYLQALESAATYTIVDNQLHLINTNGTSVLVYTNVENAEVTPGPQVLTGDALRNTSYTIEDLGEVRLVDGAFEHKYGDGATMVDKVGIVSIATGDLDGDGHLDAGVILWWQSGGSGTFLYLVAVRNQDGIPQQAGILPLGDRVQPGEFTINDAVITLEFLTHGPDDPLCCPSQQVIQTYALTNDGLSLTSSENVSP